MPFYMVFANNQSRHCEWLSSQSSWQANDFLLRMMWRGVGKIRVLA